MPLPMQQMNNVYQFEKRGKSDTTRIMIRPKKKTLIIGWNNESLRLFDKIKEYSALNYEVKGFISVNKISKKVKYRDVQLLGNISSIKTWVTLLNIEEILIAIEPEHRHLLDEILKLIHQIERIGSNSTRTRRSISY